MTSYGEGVYGSAEYGIGGLDDVKIFESLSFSELLTGAKDDDYSVAVIDGTTLAFAFTQELHYDGITDSNNYAVVPDTLASGGLPVTVESVEVVFQMYQTGSSGGALPFLPESFETEFSQYFQFSGVVTGANEGDFIFIKSGANAGHYQVVSVAVNTPGFVVFELDRDMALGDGNNGIHSATSIRNESGQVSPGVEVIGVNEFRINHPALSVDNPIKAIHRLEIMPRSDGTPSQFYTPSDASYQDNFELLTYNTFRLNGTQPTEALGDEFSVSFQGNASVEWEHRSGVLGLSITTTKLTDEADYIFSAVNLRTVDGASFTPTPSGFHTTGVPAPRVAQVSIDEEGRITVRYDQPMQVDSDNLGNIADYTVTGPTPVRILGIQPQGDSAVVLTTVGIGDGDYTLTVSSNTPKDIAGNPLDPTFNSAVFTSTAPLTSRSIFTDTGPIARPPLVSQSGATATIDTFNTITLPGATLTVANIGHYVTLSGSASNDQTLRIEAIPAGDQVQVPASLIAPDANSGAISWEVFDSREGQIADDPSDVTVRVNGSPVTPEAVIGLRGQVVLDATPAPADDVQVDYCWCPNPTVEIRRLNSKEFRLNSWNRDGNGVPGHQYRYNNVLVTPLDYEPDHPQAPLPSPQLRDLKYRAYERAYTAVLNDPNLLLLNTPSHKIAYPPPSRPLAETAVFYEGLSLPEDDTVNPWDRKGLGTASAVAGVLTVTDNSTGDFPLGQGIFWTLPLDLTFDHAFSAAWRFSLDSVTTQEGVWTGVAAGYTDPDVGIVVGYLDDGGVKKIGFFKRGSGDDIGNITSWSGGLDGNGDPTGLPVEFDWSILHSYRIFRDSTGVIRLFVDGDIVETLKLTTAEFPFLEELNAPFDDIQGAFFGSLSRVAESVSSWDFYRYLIQPANALQTSPSSYVSYEANVIPELDPSPWVPIGYHGEATILSNDFLLLDSTSANASADIGLIEGDFRGYVKLEPLLSYSSQFSVDFDVQLLTFSHGISPNGLMVGVDDGTRLMQLCFFPDVSSGKLSYGGRAFPTDLTIPWSAMGTQTSELVGRVLKITDADAADGLVYYIEDTAPVGSPDRVAASTLDYFVEARLKVESFTPDGAGFAGAFAQMFDGTRAVGLLLREVAGVRYVAFHSDGVLKAQFAFEWNDGEFHTYRMRNAAGSNLVSLFADGVLLGLFNYSNFDAPPPDPIGLLSFGSSTALSAGAESVVEWAYCNAWRAQTTERRYMGLWKGSDDTSLLGYHLPLKTTGKGATVAGNAIGDTLADYLAANVVSGDNLIVDAGPNRGVYEVDTVVDGQTLTITTAWPHQPSEVDYRIVKETDWTASTKYRIFRDSSGNVAVFLDSDPVPEITVGYNSIDLPVSGVGIVQQVSGGLPAVAFGSFDAANLEQTLWSFVRYGITRSPTEQRIVPPHQVLNQWNVMESPERLFTVIPHDRTDFKSSSVGITPQTAEDFLQRDDVTAYTQLNEGTPLVPQTQTFENRGPYATEEFVSVLNNPEDVLNNDGDFVLNDGTKRFALVVPDDVLYTCLKVYATSTGDTSLLKPFSEGRGPQYGAINYLNEVCLDYTADTLPEDDTAAATPWTLVSDFPNEVNTSIFGGVLTYGTTATGTRTVYRNNTPLPDAPSLQTEVTFRLKLLNDGTGGTGDTQVRFGLSAPGMTLGLAFVTTATAERYLLAFDLNNAQIVGGLIFDFLDGNFHTYRIVRDPGLAQVQIFIDS